MSKFFRSDFPLCHTYVQCEIRLIGLSSLCSVHRHLRGLRRPVVSTWSSRGRNYPSKSAMEHKGNESIYTLRQDQEESSPLVNQVTQYDCCHDNLAPAGCTQYFYGSNSQAVKVSVPFLGMVSYPIKHKRLLLQHEIVTFICRPSTLTGASISPIRTNRFASGMSEETAASVGFRNVSESQSRFFDDMAVLIGFDDKCRIRSKTL